MKRDLIFTGLLGVLIALSLPAVTARAETGLGLRFESGPFELNDGGIDVDGFGFLADPGKPRLPARTYLFLLPPGAKALRVELLDSESSSLPGTFRIDASPPILPLAEEQSLSRLMRETFSQWKKDRWAAYASDEAYPEEPVWIVGSGSMRKYSYVALRFAPFAYHPLSDRLVHYKSVDVSVVYRLPEAGSEEEIRLSRILGEKTSDGKASRLFGNFADMAPLYDAAGGTSGERDETYDYVILTPASLAGSILASGFVDWKASQGYNVRIVSLSDPEIIGQPGIDLAARIRNFLREYYGPWGIEYALLVGSYETLPMRYCFPDPANHEHHPDSPGNYGGSVPTDSYYADLSLSDAESWDLDGDGYFGEYEEDAPDFLAEISVGRIPSDNPARVGYALAKIVRYEQDTGNWKDQALHAGAILFHENQDGMDIPFRDGAVCMDRIETFNMGGWNVDHYCEHEGLAPSSYNWPSLTEDNFTSAWRAGRWGLVTWASHGKTYEAMRTIWTWDDGDGVFETDGSDGVDHPAFLAEGSELEDDYPSIVWAVSCNIGWPESNPEGNLGVDLMTRPGSGAAAGIISATRTAYVSAYWPDDPGGTESMCCEFNRFLIDGPDGPELAGDAHFDSKFYCFVSFPLDSYLEYKDQYSFNLYGDPAMARKGAIMTGVEETDPIAATPRIVLHQNQPNPFNPSTEIRFELFGAERVEAVIYASSGRRVATLLDGDLTAGRHSLTWDGTNDGGAPMPSGLYICRIAGAAGGDASRKMVLLK